MRAFSQEESFSEYPPSWGFRLPHFCMVNFNRRLLCVPRWEKGFLQPEASGLAVGYQKLLKSPFHRGYHLPRNLLKEEEQNRRET